MKTAVTELSKFTVTGNKERGATTKDTIQDTEIFSKLTLSTEFVFFPRSASFLQAVVTHKTVQQIMGVIRLDSTVKCSTEILCWQFKSHHCEKSEETDGSESTICKAGKHKI